MDFLFEIAEKFEISRMPLFKKALIYVLKNNRSAGLPYHNTDHNLWVARASAGGLAYYKENDELMLCAGLFHDFNHSGDMTVHDSVNITNAINGWVEFCKENDVPQNEVECGEIYIKTTQFPENPEFIKECGSLVEVNWVLRDADLLYCIKADWIQPIVFGLAEEWNQSLAERIDHQLKYIESAKFKTKWAEEQFDRMKADMIANVTYLKTLLCGKTE